MKRDDDLEPGELIDFYDAIGSDLKAAQKHGSGIVLAHLGLAFFVVLFYLFWLPSDLAMGWRAFAFPTGASVIVALSAMTCLVSLQASRTSNDAHRTVYELIQTELRRTDRGRGSGSVQGSRIRPAGSQPGRPPFEWYRAAIVAISVGLVVLIWFAFLRAASGGQVAS